MAKIDYEKLAPMRKRFSSFPCPYWVTGGWALSLFAGRKIREHSDVDVMVLARDIEHVWATFASPRPLVQDPNTGEVHEWSIDEEVSPGRTALVFPDERGSDHPVQILLGDSDHEEWIFHRGGGRIRKPLKEATLFSDEGIRYLAPEIVLLLKSRHMRAKDTEDFLSVLDKLGDERRKWLYDRVKPVAEHPWPPKLAEYM